MKINEGYVKTFIPTSHIYRDIACFWVSAGLQGWSTGPAGCIIGTFNSITSHDHAWQIKIAICLFSKWMNLHSEWFYKNNTRCKPRKLSKTSWGVGYYNCTYHFQLTSMSPILEGVYVQLTKLEGALVLLSKLRGGGFLSNIPILGG